MWFSFKPVKVKKPFLGANGKNAFRWYDTADQVVECKYCHSKQAFIKGMGVESAIKVVGGKEEAETDSSALQKNTKNGLFINLDLALKDEYFSENRLK